MHALTFGSINLIGTQAELVLLGYKFQTPAEETDFGNPVTIEQKIQSWLQDGALVQLDGYDNRDDLVIPVRITGTNSDKLAQAEKALMLETGKTNTLIWTPPDGFGLPCVFSVVMSKLENPDYDDLAELNLNQAHYRLRIQAEPFVRSADLTTVTKAAPTGTQTLTTIDDGTSTTGWSGSAPDAGSISLSTSGGLVRLAAQQPWSGGPGVKTVKLNRTGLAVSLSTTPYLRITVNFNTLNSSYISTTGVPTFKFNGIDLPIAMQFGNVYWFDTTGTGVGTTLTTMSISMTYQVDTTQGIASIGFDLSQRSNVLGEVGTNRQLTRTLEVAGSARTQGSLAIEDATNSLGDVLVYTTPSASGIAQPNLRTALSSGNVQSADTSTVSGFTSDLSVLHTFDVNANALLPGGYLLLARVKHASSGGRALTWAAKARMGSTNLAGGQSGSRTATLTAGVYSIVRVGRMNLPPRKLGSSGKVRIELQGPSGVTLDEAWLFNIETGRLSQFSAGTAAPSAGGSANRAWLDAPTLNSPIPALYLGTQADRSDAFHVADEAQSFLVHEFLPTSMNVFTVTTNSVAATITLSHYPRFHTRVASA